MLIRICSFLLILLFGLSLTVAQEYALDIKTDKQFYISGENLTFTVLLLQDKTPIKDEVLVSISDYSGKNLINKTLISNDENYFFIDKDFISGYWEIEAFYKNKSVKRFFSLGEREEAEFSINNGKLIIKNTGNVPYTKNVHILIGEKAILQKQNIEVGESKEISLIAPEGSYNIQVSDGTKTMIRADISLHGTGNVIGALDEKLLDNSQSVLGGIRDPSEETFSIAKHISPAFIFIGAVGALAVLIYFERAAQRRANMKIKSTIGSIKKQHRR